MASSQRRPKVMFLTGAPLLNELEPDQLFHELQPPIQRFLDRVTSNELPNPTPSNNWPNWRSLGSDQQETRKAETEVQNGDDQFSFLSVASQHDPDILNYNFLENSLLAFTRNEKNDDLTNTFDESTFLGESFLSEATEDSYVAPLEPPGFRFPPSVANLKSIPKAEMIERSYPQTMTENILVGIISTTAPRVIHIPRFGNSRRIVEVVVGDETRTGFPITFWLPFIHKAQTGAIPALEQKLKALRSNQIVLMTNISLSVYRGNVYGQSMRNENGKATGTDIVRLDDNGSASGTLPPLLLKKRDRVQSWIFDFLHVADRRSAVPQTPAPNVKKRGYQALIDESQLPPDSL